MCQKFGQKIHLKQLSESFMCTNTKLQSFYKIVFKSFSCSFILIDVSEVGDSSKNNWSNCTMHFWYTGTCYSLQCQECATVASCSVYVQIPHNLYTPVWVVHYLWPTAILSWLGLTEALCYNFWAHPIIFFIHWHL